MTRISKLERALSEVDSLLHKIYTSNIPSCFVRLLRGLDAQQVAISSDEYLREIGLIDILESSEFGIIHPPQKDFSKEESEEWTHAVAGADVGITSAVGISEETGTMLLRPHYPDERAVSLLPPLHLAVMSKDQINEDVEALMKKWQSIPDATEGSAVLITGPSRTADIEKELVLGVHGPQSLEVALII